MPDYIALQKQCFLFFSEGTPKDRCEVKANNPVCRKSILLLYLNKKYTTENKVMPFIKNN